MKKLLFANFIIPFLLYLNCFYIILSFIEPINKKEKYNDINEEKLHKEEKNSSILNIVQLLMVLTVFIIGIILVFKYQIKLILIPTYIFGFIMMALALLYSFSIFVKYLIRKPAKTELTEDQQNAITFLALIYSVTSGAIVNDSHKLITIINTYSLVLRDSITVLSLIIWYFLSLFFAFALLYLSCRKLKLVINKFFKPTEKIKATIKKKDSILKITKYSESIKNKIDKTNSIRIKIMFYFIWFFAFILDTIIIFLDVIIKEFASVITIVIVGIPKLACFIIKLISRILRIESGIIIIYVSRFSIILSSIIVYVIDKYNNVLSNAGSDIFSYLSSVIIIPIILTQLMEWQKN